MNIGSIVLQIVLGSIITAPALWYAGKWMVGPSKAKFTDALWITVLGVVVNSILSELVSGGIGSLVQLVAYLYLVKTYYETDWLKAAIIAVVAVVILVVVGVILGLLGFAIIAPTLA
ncbi:MAG: hypothetical protein ACXAEX_21660 [Promethearchaeota archaeon]|jgi:hypothetical protein